jgi:glycosyltransferase involved in cell wall biosynthesis
MRIALVHYSYLPVIAGVELVISAHARLFCSAGHAVTMVETSGHLALAQLAQREVENGAPGSAFAEAREALTRSLRPIFAAHDMVIVHNVLTMHFNLALTAALWELADELPNVRFIGWVHDLAAINPDYAPLPLVRPPWDLLAKAHPRWLYVAVSDLRSRQFARLTGEPEERCRTIPNGVDPTELFDLPAPLAALTAQHGLLERDVVLLHPTRLLRRKNVELTLRVSAAIKATGRSCACLITAPPDVHHRASTACEEELRVLRYQLDLEPDAIFLSDEGPLDAAAMRGLFALAHALFFPSWQEGFGIPVLEAALHRLPIFCSDLEPLNTLLPDRVTRFAPDAPPAAVAALVATTLETDRAWAARRETVRSYSWNAIYRNFLSPLLAEPETP